MRARLQYSRKPPALGAPFQTALPCQVHICIVWCCMMC